MVVRSVRGDAVAIWTRDQRLRGAASRWFIYPVDPKTGEAGEPLALEPEQLAELPRPCTEGDDGWLLEGSPPVEPYLDLVGADDFSRPRRVVARIVASSHGLCLDSLSGEAASALPRSSRRGVDMLDPGRPTVPFVLADRGRGGVRWELRCSR